MGGGWAVGLLCVVDSCSCAGGFSGVWGRLSFVVYLPNIIGNWPVCVGVARCGGDTVRATQQQTREKTKKQQISPSTIEQ